MVLDAVLADPDVVWLGTERDKLAHFRALHEPSARGHAAADLSQSQRRGDRALLPGPAAHRLPSGWRGASLPVPGARAGSVRLPGCSCSAMARCSVRWPSGGFACSCPHISRALRSRIEVACWNEFATPLKPVNARRAALVFRAAARARRSLAGFRRGAVPASPRQFVKPRFRALYRAVAASRVMDCSNSRDRTSLATLSNAAADRWIAMFSTRRYSHLSPLVGSV